MNYFKNKKILITGHTGFKGSWLTLYLLVKGAKIMGISNNIPTKPSLFKILKLQKKIKHVKADIRNLKKIKKYFLKFNPDFVFHLAAQSLVKKSYNKPLDTWSTNLFGTLNVLECLKFQKKNSISVLITSDKSYKNLETKKGYKENDALGGVDPYGASKSAADIAISSYIKSYFSSGVKKKIAIARAGNVIGGGDWSEDRLLADCFKHWLKNKKVNIRNPHSTRPWQHVIDVINGYTKLAIKLKKNKKLHGNAFNFGPQNLKKNRVKDILLEIATHWPRAKWKVQKEKKRVFENTLLNLNSEKSKKLLLWKPKLNLKQSLKMTVEWYKSFSLKKNMRELSIQQLKRII